MSHISFQVHCLADAVRVSLEIKDFNGVLYVKGYSKDERCRLMVHIPVNQERLVDFTVRFGDCGLVHVNVSCLTQIVRLISHQTRAF